jgi:hypothetical protein
MICGGTAHTARAARQSFSECGSNADNLQVLTFGRLACATCVTFELAKHIAELHGLCEFRRHSKHLAADSAHSDL